MKVRDCVKVLVSFGRYDENEIYLNGYIEAIYPDPPINIDALKYYNDREVKYPGFWASKKERDNKHFSGLCKWNNAYWVHITDESVANYNKTTMIFYDSDIKKCE